MSRRPEQDRRRAIVATRHAVHVALELARIAGLTDIAPQIEALLVELEGTCQREPVE